MSDEDDESTDGFGWNMMPIQLSEEQIAEIKKHQDRNNMRREEYIRTFRRLIAEELTYEQLETVHAMVQHIVTDPSIATWYEGMLYGSLTVRDVVLGQDKNSEL